jgi:hypothetical protein
MGKLQFLQEYNILYKNDFIKRLGTYILQLFSLLLYTYIYIYIYSSKEKKNIYIYIYST